MKYLGSEFQVKLFHHIEQQANRKIPECKTPSYNFGIYSKLQ